MSGGTLGQEGDDEARTGQSVGARVLFDYDNAFSLKTPNRAWRLIGEDDARKMAPDACAGLRGTGRVRGVQLLTIVEHLPDLGLAEYGEIVVGSIALQDVERLGTEEVTIDGLAALRLEVSGKLGADLRFVLYVVRRGEYLQQVIVYGHETILASGRVADEAVGAIAWMDSPIKPRAAVGFLRDARGVGWVLEGGKFKSLPYGFRVRAPSGFHVAVGDELRSMSTDAEVGLVGSEPDMYVTITAEAASGDGSAEILAAVLMDAEDSTQYRVTGSDRLFSRWTDDSTGLDLEFLHGAWLEDETCLQITAWYQVAQREEARAQVQAVLDGIRMLTEDERETLRARLLAEPDTDSAVSVGQTLRAGVFVDFEHGVSWRKPEQGMWRATAGPSLLAIEEPDSQLFLEEPETGLFVRLYFDQSSLAEDAVAYHDYTVNTWSEDYEVIERGEPRVMTSPNSELLITELDVAGDPAPYHMVIATAWRDGLGIDMVASGMRSNLEDANGLINACLAELSVHPEPLVALEQTESRVHDRRLGFAVDVPEGWVVSDETPVELADVGRVINLLDGEDVRISVAAVHPPTSDGYRVEHLATQLGGFLPSTLRGRALPAEEWKKSQLGELSTRSSPLRGFLSTTGEVHSLSAAGTVFAVFLFGNDAERAKARGLFGLAEDPLGEL